MVTIGSFDGLHPGHLAILGRLKQLAAEVGGESLVITFHPHPRLVLFPEDNELRLLQTLDEKLERLELFGIHKVLVLPFTPEFARITSARFIDEILVQTIGAHTVIVGYDHRFGRNRTGGLDDLRKGALVHHFRVEEIPAQQIDDANVSSTKIRNALLAGDTDQANRLLGYPYTLTGLVVHGDKRGRTIGFPTANLEVLDPAKLVPTNGVYAVQVHYGGRRYQAMMNIGTRPTVGGTRLALEVHILGFDGDMYGQHLRVDFGPRLRDEQRFGSLDELKAQLARDREDAMAWQTRSDLR